MNKNDNACVSAHADSCMNAHDNACIIYTDGSCVEEVGGFGIVILRYGKVKKISGKVPIFPCTNQKAELYAIVRFVEKYYENEEEVVIYTDSKYAIGCCTDWITTWKKNDWKTANKKEVKNRELIERIDFKLNSNITFKHVKGHSGDKWNEEADRLANKGRIIK